MNTLEHEQEQGTSQGMDIPRKIYALELIEMAEPIGTFGGLTDTILRFRNGVPVPADTGDQGGGQN
jgi:hypothetical protein